MTNDYLNAVPQLIKKMVSMHLNMNKTKILVVGLGKEIDNEYNYDTDVLDMVVELQTYNIKTHCFDPNADTEFLKTQHNIHCENDMKKFGMFSTYNGFIITPHSNMFNLSDYKRGRFALIEL